jgi:hypothetical protein
MQLSGAVKDVVLRGEDLIRDGTFIGRRGAGRFQERSLEAQRGAAG